MKGALASGEQEDDSQPPATATATYTSIPPTRPSTSSLVGDAFGLSSEKVKGIAGSEGLLSEVFSCPWTSSSPASVHCGGGKRVVQLIIKTVPPCEESVVVVDDDKGSLSAFDFLRRIADRCRLFPREEAVYHFLESLSPSLTFSPAVTEMGSSLTHLGTSEESALSQVELVIPELVPPTTVPSFPLLALEHLGPHGFEPLSNYRPLSPEEIMSAVDALAQFHGRVNVGAGGGGLSVDALPDHEEPFWKKECHRILKESVERVLLKPISPQHRVALKYVSNHLEFIVNAQSEPLSPSMWTCLIHGDFISANILVQPASHTGQRTRIAFIDFQWSHVDVPLCDLFTLLYFSTNSATRSLVEELALKKYHEVLLSTVSSLSPGNALPTKDDIFSPEARKRAACVTLIRWSLVVVLALDAFFPQEQEDSLVDTESSEDAHGASASHASDEIVDGETEDVPGGEVFVRCCDALVAMVAILKDEKLV